MDLDIYFNGLCPRLKILNFGGHYMKDEVFYLRQKDLISSLSKQEALNYIEKLKNVLNQSAYYYVIESFQYDAKMEAIQKLQEFAVDNLK